MHAVVAAKAMRGGHHVIGGGTRGWSDAGRGETWGVREHSSGVRALIVPYVVGGTCYGVDSVAPPGNQAANGEHKQIPTGA
jgi:hypothetical protein